MRTVLVVVAVFALATPAMALPPEYTISALAPLTGSRSQAWSINESGQAVGWSRYSSSIATLWDGQATTGLDTLGGSESNARAINEQGQVVGRIKISGDYKPFLWQNGVMSELDLQGHDQGVAFDINDHGVTVGAMEYAHNQWRAVAWDGSGLVELGQIGGATSARGINNLGQIVGENGDDRPVVWDGATWTTLTPLSSSLSRGVAYAINDSGQIVGLSRSSNGSTVHATLWSQGQPIDLNTQDATGSLGRSLNNLAQVVGEANFVGLTGPQAFLWEDSVMYNLNDLIPADSGWQLWTAYGINDLGQIVGEGYTPGGPSWAYVLNPVPEPATVGLVALGLAALAARRRRRGG